MDPAPVERRLARILQAAASAALALAGLFAGNNADTLGHLAQGRQIMELGRVPSTDTWSLLHAGRPWLNYEWLSDLLFYALYASVGYDGLIAMKCTLLAGAAWLLVGLAERHAGPRGAALGAVALLAAIPAMRFRLSDRPHVLGMVLAAVYIAVLARLVAPQNTPSSRARAGLVALLAGLHVLWVNLHGSHLLGAVITCGFVIFAPRDARRPLLVLLGLEAAASWISPWGPPASCSTPSATSSIRASASSSANGTLGEVAVRSCSSCTPSALPCSSRCCCPVSDERAPSLGQPSRPRCSSASPAFARSASSGSSCCSRRHGSASVSLRTSRDSRRVRS